mmetsp:Transcript_35287/g.99143  ORF Transcript_35287/g.99143 Transcript_35287/m.99143 type:complete len:211 (-) Transcript_35287:353-985(-)
MRSLQSSKSSSCVPGVNTASKAYVPPSFTSKVILSVACVISRSPSCLSFRLKGRTRQMTRIDPLRSSMALWVFFRWFSASWMSASTAPTATASLIAPSSSALAPRRASMLVWSAAPASCIAALIAPITRSCLTSCLSWDTASLYSEYPKLAASAASMARRRAAIERVSRASASRMRASCLGISSARAALAFAMCLLSTPASLACCSANFM